MFKKLKQKIQEETGAPPDTNFSHGPGVASPVSKDPPGGGFLPMKRDSPLRDAGRRDSVDSTASVDESTKSKEEVLAMLLKRTEQVKRSEGKVSELAAMIKEKNRQIERLEISLENSEEASAQKIQELSTQQNSNKGAASDKQEEEFRARIGTLEKSNEDLQKKLREAVEYREKYFKRAEEDDELQGLNTQELAKIKHMLLNTQEELGKRRAELEEKSEQLESSEKQVKQLENEVMQLAEKLSEQQLHSEKFAVDLNEEKKRTEQLTKERNSLKTQLDSKTSQLSQKAAQLSSLQTSYHELQDDSMVAQRNSDLHRQKTSTMIEQKDDQITQLQDQVTTLEQRVQDSGLDGDERLTAMEAERKTMEAKLQEARQQLTEVKTVWSDKITHLEKQISNLNQKIAEDAQELGAKQKELLASKAEKDRAIESARSECREEADQAEQKLNAKLEKLQSDLAEQRKEDSKKSFLINSKNQDLEQQKKQLETDLKKMKQAASDRELELKDAIQDLEAKVVSLEKARERDRQSSQQKIASLETSHDEWLEKDIDTEKQITSMEEQLQKVRAESAHRERDNARLQQQLTDRLTELTQLKEKTSGMQRSTQASQENVEQLKKDLQLLGTDFQSATKEKNDLLVRNAELFQQLEASKHNISESTHSYQEQLNGRETAIAGLEQSIQDLTSELTAAQQKISLLEQEAKNAKHELESAELNKLRNQMSGMEDQLADRNKTIKVQQQRMIDLKKTLQRELKVQALPNDDPTNNSDAPQLEISSSSSASVNSNKSMYKFDMRTFSGNNSFVGDMGNLRPPKVPAGAMNVMSRCSAGQDCLCEHVNFEYLKHVLIKFMTSREHEAVHLIRAVAVLLHLSLDEQRVIKDTLEWKMSWGFASRPKMGKGQMSKVIPPSW